MTGPQSSIETSRMKRSIGKQRSIHLPNKEEQLKKDEEKFSDEDKKKKEKIDMKNEAESFIYTTEKLVNHDLKDKISQEQGIKVTDAVKEVKEVLDKDIEELKPKLEALKTTVNEITTELYKNATPPPGADQDGAGQQEQPNDGQQEQTTGEQKSESSTEETKNN